MNSVYIIFVPDTGYDIPAECYYKIISQHCNGHTATEQLQTLEILKGEVSNLMVMLKDGCILCGVKTENRNPIKYDTITLHSQLGVEVILAYLRELAPKYLWKRIIGTEKEIPSSMLVPISADMVINKFPLLFPGKLNKICRTISSFKEDL